MTFARIMFAALKTDTFACEALAALSSAKQAETMTIDEGETIDTELPIFPVFSYTRNGTPDRFPSKAIRVINTDKIEQRFVSEIPLPSFAEPLVTVSKTAIALKDATNNAELESKIATALKNFHCDRTGENLQPGVKTNKPKRRHDKSSYCGLWR